MTGFIDALNALDADAMSAFFAEDITAFVPLAQGDRVQGREAVTRIFRNFVARTKPATSRLNLVPEDLEIMVSGDLGIATFNIREKAPDVTRRRTFVFKRSGDQWLIRHFHASDFLAAPK
jgi:ketosteroid isomerase-like protein